MSDDDLLVRASRALRESHDGRSAASTETGHRILALARRRSAARRKTVTFVAGFAALLALTTAWAATTGRLAGLGAMLRGTSSVPHRATGNGGAGDAPQPAVTGAPLEPPSEPPTSAPPPLAVPPPPSGAVAASPPAARSTGQGAGTPAQPGVAPPPSAAGSGEAVDGESRLYAVAHKAHFVTRDPAQALQAWDAYLQAYPAGRFALEARYNRALTLVRLGQLDEARTALTPFANGEAGGYRQREARELLDAMK